MDGVKALGKEIQDLKTVADLNSFVRKRIQVTVPA
jgi:hypothetical protein